MSEIKTKKQLRAFLKKNEKDIIEYYDQELSAGRKSIKYILIDTYKHIMHKNGFSLDIPVEDKDIEHIVQFYMYNLIKTKKRIDKFGPTLEERLSKEPFFIILHSEPNNLLLEYSRKKGGRLVSISEINASEEIICGCRFKGKSSSGEKCPQWIKELKPYYSQIKPNEWPATPIYVTSFYQH